MTTSTGWTPLRFMIPQCLGGQIQATHSLLPSSASAWLRECTLFVQHSDRMIQLHLDPALLTSWFIPLHISDKAASALGASLEHMIAARLNDWHLNVCTHCLLVNAIGSGNDSWEVAQLQQVGRSPRHRGRCHCRRIGGTRYRCNCDRHNTGAPGALHNSTQYVH